jgi:hypothetical protein
MKRFYLPIIIALLTAMIYSCADDTQFTPESPPSIYETPEEAFAVADVLYRTGAPAFFGEGTLQEVPAAMIGGYLSGFFARETGAETRLYESTQRLSFNDAAMSEYVNNVWNRVYQAIDKSNELIANIPGTQGLTSEQKSRLVAEARFFRAFNYFYLAKWFGGAPLVTESSSNNVPRSELSEVYKLIVSDLERAIIGLPDETFARNGFRVTRSVAQTLLADVYLTMSGFPLQQNHYRQAVVTARQVIAGGKHTLADNGATPDASAYNRLRTQNDNAEHIYSYKPEQSNRSLSSFTLSKDAASWGVVKINTTNAYMPTQAFMNIYDPHSDMRSREQQFFHTFVRYERSGRTVIQTFSHKPYWWFDRDALFETGTADNNVSIYRYAEVLLIAAEAIVMTDGVTSEAAGYLADIRARAWTNIGREAIFSELMSLDRERFVEEVWAERLREFPFEMKIWNDIQRTRKYPETSPNDRGNIVFRDVIGTPNAMNIPFEEGHLLLPVR